MKRWTRTLWKPALAALLIGLTGLASSDALAQRWGDRFGRRSAVRVESFYPGYYPSPGYYGWYYDGYSTGGPYYQYRVPSPYGFGTTFYYGYPQPGGYRYYDYSVPAYRPDYGPGYWY
ncbi:MAG: hypothetical protein WD847_09005 [Pirellulales bacterium]